MLNLDRNHLFVFSTKGHSLGQRSEGVGLVAKEESTNRANPLVLIGLQVLLRYWAAEHWGAPSNSVQWDPPLWRTLACLLNEQGTLTRPLGAIYVSGQHYVRSEVLGLQLQRESWLSVGGGYLAAEAESPEDQPGVKQAYWPERTEEESSDNQDSPTSENHQPNSRLLRWNKEAFHIDLDTRPPPSPQEPTQRNPLQLSDINLYPWQTVLAKD
ncbi:hypothetical protein NQZ68_005390 [Dissostichus eleginoides]|nr:hypothetical protein NQZ68_005390 [Dissostichus eleginoides]